MSNRPKLLLIDDDLKVHSGWQKALGTGATLVLAHSPWEAIAILSSPQNIHFSCVIVARMFQQDGDILFTDIPERLKQLAKCPVLLNWQGYIGVKDLNERFDGKVFHRFGIKWSTLRPRLQKIQVALKVAMKDDPGWALANDELNGQEIKSTDAQAKVSAKRMGKQSPEEKRRGLRQRGNEGNHKSDGFGLKDPHPIKYSGISSMSMAPSKYATALTSKPFMLKSVQLQRRQKCANLLRIMAENAELEMKEKLLSYLAHDLNRGMRLLEELYNRLVTYRQHPVNSPSVYLNSSPIVAARIIRDALEPK